MSMKKFMAGLELIQEEMKNNSMFCGEVCTVCGGDKQNCTVALIMNIRNLERAKEGLTKTIIEQRRLITELRKNKPVCNPTNKLGIFRVGQYIKLKKLSLEQVLPLIGTGKRIQVDKGVFVSTSGVRLRTFKDNVVCVDCGLIGTHFWAESNDKGMTYHLNLYAINSNGHEILMTKDHIYPRSKGGSDLLENMQTMCTNCNVRKGDKIIPMKEIV